MLNQLWIGYHHNTSVAILQIRFTEVTICFLFKNLTLHHNELVLPYALLDILKALSFSWSNVMAHSIKAESQTWLTGCVTLTLPQFCMLLKMNSREISPPLLVHSTASLHWLHVLLFLLVLYALPHQ
jgi:hypothetical protein